VRRMIDIWDERPLIYIEESEDADKLDAWLEKLKTEYDRLDKTLEDARYGWSKDILAYLEVKEKAEKWDAAVKGMRILEGMYDLDHITLFMETMVEDVNSSGEKLEVITTFLKDTIYDKIWVECRDVEFAKEILTLIEDYNDE